MERLVFNRFWEPYRDSPTWNSALPFRIEHFDDANRTLLVYSVPGLCAENIVVRCEYCEEHQCNGLIIEGRKKDTLATIEHTVNAMFMVNMPVDSIECMVRNGLLYINMQHKKVWQDVPVSWLT